MKKSVQLFLAFTMIFSVNTSVFAEVHTVPDEELTVQQTQAAVGPFLVKQGMRGEQVRMVQNLLKEAGFYDGSVDGVFGNYTYEMVKSFQFTHGLLADGVVGELTLEAIKRAEPVTNRNMRSLMMTASAYSAYDPGNSSYTATGSYLRKGVVAVDPNLIPLGTRLFIPGYGYAVADDIGGSIIGNRIDLAFDSHGEALAFGRRDIVVYIVE